MFVNTQTTVKNVFLEQVLVAILDSFGPEELREMALFFLILLQIGIFLQNHSLKKSYCNIHEIDYLIEMRF